MALLLFLLGAGFAAYVVAGYPLLLAALARFRSKPIRKRFEPLRVTVLMAVYNGEKWIRAKLDSILQQNYPRDRVQILVISDGSTDRTEAIATEFRAAGVECLRVPHGGKALALNAGMARATGDVLFFTDVRQPLHPEALRHLVACLGDPNVGGASGEIDIATGGASGEADVGLYWRYEKWLRQKLTETGSLLVATGCIYVLRRTVARPLPPDTLIDDAYLPLSAILEGYRFVFERQAIAYDYPTALHTEFRRKVRTLAGLYQLVGNYPRLLNLFTSTGFHFFSYKLSRVLLPYAMLLMAASAFWLPAPWAAVTLAVQAFFYGLAAIDHWVPAGSLVKRLSSVCRTFVVMLAAGLCAAAILFVPASRLWKETKVQAADRDML